MMKVDSKFVYISSILTAFVVSAIGMLYENVEVTGPLPVVLFLKAGSGALLSVGVAYGLTKAAGGEVN